MQLDLRTIAPTSTAWTGILVRERLREAFEIERRLPGSRRNHSAWPWPVVYSFADLVGRVAMGEPVRLTGATPAEISRMDEALAWFAILQHHPDERKYLAAWAACSGSVRAMVAGRGPQDKLAQTPARSAQWELPP